jgi:hypothetical protein
MKISAAFSTFGMWIPAAWVLIQYRRRLAREHGVCAQFALLNYFPMLDTVIECRLPPPPPHGRMHVFALSGRG